MVPTYGDEPPVMSGKRKRFEGEGFDKRQARRLRRKAAQRERECRSEHSYIVITHDKPWRWEYI